MYLHLSLMQIFFILGERCISQSIGLDSAPVEVHDNFAIERCSQCEFRRLVPRCQND